MAYVASLLLFFLSTETKEEYDKKKQTGVEERERPFSVSFVQELETIGMQATFGIEKSPYNKEAPIVQ